MENLLGRQIKGFRFEGDDFMLDMKQYIGEIGVIEYANQRVKVRFEDHNYWFYPLDKIQQHLIPLEVFKLGQKVWDMSISEDAGVVVNIDSGYVYPIEVEFINENSTYTKDGRINENYQKTLSTTPYTFLGFSHETIIERGTVVYFRNSKNLDWNFGFYSHRCENEFDYCFVDQQKEGDSLPWNFCQTENPLI